MIFFARLWRGSAKFDPARSSNSLGLFAGSAASSCREEADFFAEQRTPRGKAGKGWRVASSRAGLRALLVGWIDNTAALASQLGIIGADAATVYATAVEHWGDEADRHVIGTYAAIVTLPNGVIRLSRSPWGGKSLFYFQSDEGLIACSITRPIFAAGVEQRLRQSAVDKLLTMQRLNDDESFFREIHAVPHGSIVRIEQNSCKVLRWYDPLAIAPLRLGSDEEYQEAANVALTEAVRSALKSEGKIGMTLSGGLDSSIVCDEILQQLPGHQRLTSFTFHPLGEWDGKVPANSFGDERPYVEAFARMHSRLDPVFVDNRGIAFDDRADQMFTACESGYPARILGSPFHGIFDTARAHGCDWVFGADWGNMTFSSNAPWAFTEFLMTGRWRQLWLLARNMPADTRAVPLRIMARAILPLLPPSFQQTIRSLVRKGAPDAFANPFLSREGRLDAQRRETNLASNIAKEDTSSRSAYIADCYAGASFGAEVGHGYEQMFGLRLRDVTNYRPLIELCMGMPTTQFARNGETRLLARRMGVGRMPEAQRMTSLSGQQNVDWHVRLTPRRAELRQQVKAIESHPDIGPLIDTARMLKLIDDWPETTPDDPKVVAQFRFFLPAILYVTKYVDAMTGRNG